MSWFGEIISGAVDLFGGSDTLGSIGKIAAVAAPVAGAFISSNANQAAAEAAAKGNQAAADAIRAGQASATARADQIYADSAPARSRLLALSAADPNVLTPEQRITLDDTLRDANTRLATSGLRGAGRAGVAAVNETARRTTAGLIGQNMQRGDSAASQLAKEGLSAAARAGQIDYSAGTQQAGLAQSGATDQANLETANGRQIANALGAVASTIASDEKQAARERRNKGIGKIYASEGELA